MSSGFTGFENPTNPYREKSLNISEIIQHLSSTFLVKSESDYNSIVVDNDWLLVDSSIQAGGADLVLIEQYGEQFVLLLSAIRENSDELIIIGVVIAVIRHFSNIPDIPSNTFDLDDIHSILMPNPHVAFISRASGSNLSGFGINNNNMLIVRRDVEYAHGDLAVIYHDRRFMCRRLNLEKCRLETPSESLPMPRPLAIEGIVTSSINILRHEVLASWLMN